MIARARGAAKQEKWTEALTAISDALKIDPQSIEGRNLLWSVSRSQLTTLVRAHRWDEVKKNVDQLSRLWPSNPQLPGFLRDAATTIAAEGLNSSKQSKWDEAATAFGLSLSIKSSPEASNGLALALHGTYEAGIFAFGKRQYGDAQNKFDAVLNLQTRFSSADQKNLAPLFGDAQIKSKQSYTELILQGAIDQFDRGEYATSLAIVWEVLKSDPGNPRALALLGRLTRADDIKKAVADGQTSLANRDWAGALQQFDIALHVNKHDTRAQAGHRQATNALDQRKRNVVLAGAGIVIPASILLIILAPSVRRARIYARFGWTGRFTHLLENILERNPGRVDAVMSLSGLYSNGGRRISAVSLCTKYLMIKPGDINVLLLLAESHFELRDFDSARRVYQQVLARDSANVTACSRLLEMEDHPGGDDAGALQIYEPALRTTMSASIVWWLTST